MKPIFEYRDWKAEPSLTDFDHPPRHSFAPDEFGFAVCPEPTCLRENFEPGDASGPIVFHGACGEPTGIAIPCGDHQDFAFATGWYLRFGDAVDTDREARYGKPPTQVCRECGNQYDKYLFGWAGNGRCPECTYRSIKKPAGERTLAHA